MDTKPSVIDLFCGCGGFGLGAEMAGFRTLAAVDVDRDLQFSYRLNFPKTRVIEGDISVLDQSCWNDILGDERPDGIIGGPPCQGFSRIGKRDQSDHRNRLLFHFYRHVNLLKPRFFIMENVEGILDSYGMELLTSAIHSLRHPYEIIGPEVVDAADFGAATRRRRALIIGYLPDEFGSFPADVLVKRRRIRSVTVREAISDLPNPVSQAVTKNLFGLSRMPDSPISVSPYARAARRSPGKGLGWNTALDWFKEGRVSGFFETKHSDGVKARFRSVKAGSTDRISKYPKLDWNGVSPTLRAGTGSDRGSFQSVRPIHPSKARVITVREAARLQGFPDWFVFHPTKWHSFRMIGNSVSPKVSYHVLKSIRRAMG